MENGMDMWIPITIFAAFCQNARSALQRHFAGKLGTTGATFVRFGYGVPFALIYLAGLHVVGGIPLPEPNVSFAIFGMAGGIAQILATFLLVYLFSLRNFVAGTAYSKTEPVQAAIFGLVLLGETVTPVAGLAIAVGVVGVIFVSLAGKPVSLGSLVTALAGRPAQIGLASAAMFGLSAVCYRAASLSLGGPGFLMQASFTLAFVTVFQTAAMVVWMLLRERGQLRASIENWRGAVWVGLIGVAGSAGWFTAMTLERVAYVRALGQIELIFTFIVSWRIFREKLHPAEAIGTALIATGIVLLLLGS
jgi:drug/metabolite transporter (DMT)-like permease